MNELCEKCEEKFDCDDPCAEAIAWTPLDKKCYTAHNDYVPKGVTLYFRSGEDYRKRKAARGGRSR